MTSWTTTPASSYTSRLTESSRLSPGSKKPGRESEAPKRKGEPSILTGETAVHSLRPSFLPSKKKALPVERDDAHD